MFCLINDGYFDESLHETHIYIYIIYIYIYIYFIYIYIYNIHVYIHVYNIYMCVCGLHLTFNGHPRSHWSFTSLHDI